MFLFALATDNTARADQLARPVVEFQRAADSYAFLHRQAEREIGMAHRRAGLSVDEVASQELAARIITLRTNSPRQRLFTRDIAAALRDLAARAARTPSCDPGDLRAGVHVTSYQPNSSASGTKTVNDCIVAALPTLPAELEYRSAGTVLVLVDTHANLVVDVLPALLIGSP
jgi:hypothetical protein